MSESFVHPYSPGLPEERAVTVLADDREPEPEPEQVYGVLVRLPDGVTRTVVSTDGGKTWM